MTAAVAIHHVGRTLVRRAPASIRVVAWGAWLVLAVSVIASAAIWATEGCPALPLSFASGPVNVVGVGVIALTTGTVGALLAWRHPRNPIGWLLLAEGTLTSFLTPVNLMVWQGVDAMQLWPTTTIAAAWVMSSLMTPTTVAIGILVFFLFPDGRFPGRRWWAGALVTFLGTALLATASALDPTGMTWYPVLPNPTSVPAEFADAVLAVQLAGVALTAGAIALAAASVASRYRRADRHRRLQLRWVLVGVVVMGVTFLPFLVARYALDVTGPTSDLLLAIMALGAACFPLTVAVAIVREHLYEIDVLIWRTLVYVPLMGLLAGLYAASIAFFQRLFISLTGNGSDAAIVLSSLILASMFAPAKSAVEARVSGRLKPPDPHVHPGFDRGEPIAMPGRPTLVVPSAEERSGNGPKDRIGSLEDRVAALEAALAAEQGAAASAA